ncbi:hypothetical protein M9435_004985 [Picochlorum sp. BPE23]|nr:hypothetical protein M9435_004985 [Picochlorum sp. BPE23]
MLKDERCLEHIAKTVVRDKVTLSESEHLKHVISNQVSLYIRDSQSKKNNGPVVRQEFGQGVLTTSRFIWIPVEDKYPIVIISLSSILSVGKEKRQEWLVRRKSCEVSMKIRVDQNDTPTGNVLEFCRVLEVVVCAMKHREACAEVGGLHDALSGLLGRGLPSVPSTRLLVDASEDFCCNAEDQNTNDIISVIVGMGYDERMARAAVDGCGQDSISAESVVAWMLDHEADLQRQIDHETGFFDVGEGGFGGVFAREQEKLEKDLGVITDGLESLEKLESLADTMERLAHEIFDRKRMEKETQDDIVDDSLYAAMVNHALVMSLSKEHVQNVNVYYEELARHIGKVILEFTRSSYGVISLPEAYRLYNRSRFKEAVPPQDFVHACVIFDRVGMPLRVGCTHPHSNNRVIFSVDDSTKAIRDRIVSCIPDACEGISRVAVALRAHVPVAVARYYLEEAEFQGLLARDDGPRGLFYYKNVFHQYVI